MYLYEFKDNYYFEYVLARSKEEAQITQSKGRKKWAKSKIHPLCTIENIDDLHLAISQLKIHLMPGEQKFIPSVIGWYDYD